MVPSLRRGFTLLELIVVITVLGVLAAIAVPTFDRVEESSRTRALLTSSGVLVRNVESIASSSLSSPSPSHLVSAIGEQELSSPDLFAVPRSGADVCTADACAVELISGGVSVSVSVATGEVVASEPRASVLSSAEASERHPALTRLVLHLADVTASLAGVPVEEVVMRHAAYHWFGSGSLGCDLWVGIAIPVQDTWIILEADGSLYDFRSDDLCTDDFQGPLPSGGTMHPSENHYGLYEPRHVGVAIELP